jgi:serine phosphatase RsbU (regulator of sigma subunit)
MKDLSECRILIVDDIKANVDVLVQALRNDYKLSVALDGESALRSVEKNPPDLVLLDIMMPGIDGYEVCRRLRENEQTRDLPVMFLTSLEDVQDKARGFEIGANDYLTKPFEILEVKARVRSLVRAKAYADAIREAREMELSIAREIQMGILPSDLSACTDGTGLDIHAVLEPAQQVGGDLYDVLRAADDRVVVVLGDVSGKGIPASLFMAVTMTLVRSMARQYERPEDIVRHVSNELATQNPRKMFVTMACLVFDLKSRRVTCANAGHNPVLYFGPGKPPCFVFPSTGMVAGLFPGNSVSGESLELEPGDTMVLYSDGVTEAFSRDEELFGDKRLLAQLTDEPGRNAGETVSSILRAVRRHALGAPQSDDISIVAVHYSPHGSIRHPVQEQGRKEIE